MNNIFSPNNMAKRGAEQISPADRGFHKRHERQDSGDPLMDRMVELLSEMRDDLLKGQAVAVSSLSEEIQNLRIDLGSGVKDLMQGLLQVSDLAEKNSRRLDELLRRVNFLEEENKLLKNKQVDMENRYKQSNLVFHGIAESVEDLEAEFHRLCVHYLKLSERLRIERIHRVGSPNKDRPRTVVVKFLSYKDRELFWNNRRNLKGSRIFVEEHFAVEIQQR